MNNSFLIPLIFFLLSLAVRCVYELLKETHRINPENKPVFVVILCAMCVLWVSWFNLCPKDPVRMSLPDVLPLIGLYFFIIGTILAIGAFIQLRGVENIKHLVTAGFFKKIRHPMYIGFICWIVGWGFYHKALISLAIGVPAIICVLWWRRLEERRLEIQFGESYQQYRLRTWF